MSNNQFEIVKIAGGDSPVLVTAEEDGHIVAIKANVTLSLDNKGVCLINGNPAISASGYDMLNKVAGISVIPTRTVGVPGKGEQPNPYVLYDDRMSPRIVYARVAAVGYSPVGNIAVTDQTLHFDLEAYKQRDAMNRIKKYPRFGKLCSRSEVDPSNPGYFLPVLDANYGIWLDTTVPAADASRKGQTEFFFWLDGVMQRQQFADRIAMGFLRRNALRHHPAIGIMRVELHNGEVSIPVMAWRKDLSAEKIRSIANGDRNGVETREEIIDTEKMAEEDEGAITGEIIEEGDSLDKRTSTINDIIGHTKVNTTEKPKEPPKPRKGERESAMDRINKLRSKMGEDAWKEYWGSVVTSGRTLEQFSDKEVVKFEDKLDRYCFENGVSNG